MKSRKRIIIWFAVVAIAFLTGRYVFVHYNLNSGYEIGQKIDSLNGVYVYYNGETGTIEGRNVTKDGYNLGLKYQCVEFVKRYYYEALDHKMPDSYGNAKDFFDPSISDGKLNPARGLVQYTNGSVSEPEVGDLLILDGTMTNEFGHVAIISAVEENEIEIIQQNPGKYGKSRAYYDLEVFKGLWTIDSDRVLGWLRKK